MAGLEITALSVAAIVGYLVGRWRSFRAVALDVTGKRPACPECGHARYHGWLSGGCLHRDWDGDTYGTPPQCGCMCGALLFPDPKSGGRRRPFVCTRPLGHDGGHIDGNGMEGRGAWPVIWPANSEAAGLSEKEETHD